MNTTVPLNGPGSDFPGFPSWPFLLIPAIGVILAVVCLIGQGRR